MVLDSHFFFFFALKLVYAPLIPLALLLLDNVGMMLRVVGCRTWLWRTENSA